MGVRSEILDGLAEILWAEGWMMHVEEHGCESLRGEITEIMPPIPKDARTFADEWAAAVEKANGKTLGELYDAAVDANDREHRGTPSPEAFGNSLASMIEGSGSSWFDDNAEFDLEVPDHSAGMEVGELAHLAGSRCQAAWENPACWQCGAFSRPGSKKCSNCGAKPDTDKR